MKYEYIYKTLSTYVFYITFNFTPIKEFFLNNGIEWLEHKDKKILLINYDKTKNNHFQFLDNLDDIIKDNNNKIIPILCNGNDYLHLDDISPKTDFNSQIETHLFHSLFRKNIEDYYKPKQLIDIIYKMGQIPKNSEERIIGIGFIDIADYTFLSKFLSPIENQIVLNGLFNAFNEVLKKHGGFLNKLEGDSMEFQFGTYDNKKSRKENINEIAHRLFYSCVEMQKICFHFNQADEEFLQSFENEISILSIHEAFNIISSLRNDENTAASLKALFQIRIRIGANIGEVSIGNFGPDDAKQLDIIGMPVIIAKRMEATAPVGGFRISDEFYNILDKVGVIDEYYHKVKNEANTHNGLFKDLTKKELFKFSEVVLKDKKNTLFKSYSVLVTADLPESIASQVENLLHKDQFGVDKIIEIIKYYRGNRWITKAIEAVLLKNNVHLRKEKMIKFLTPRAYQKMLENKNGNSSEVDKQINQKYSLFSILDALGKKQDELKKNSFEDEKDPPFIKYEQYMEEKTKSIMNKHKKMEELRIKRTHFFEITFNLIFHYIRASILEYQQIPDVQPIEE